MRASANVRALRFRELMQQLVRRFGALATEATPCGQPLSIAHAHALMVLLHRGELSQQELGLELGIDKSNVARLCARMASLGHASQVRCQRDGRSRRVRLTKKGERLAREVEASSAAHFGELLAMLPAREQEPVLGAIDKLVTALGALRVARSAA